MKKICVLSLALIFVLMAFPQSEAKAYSSGWKKVSVVSGCEVRVVTDAKNYTKRATSIDAYGQSNGNCGKLHYKMELSIVEGGPVGKTFSGYFSHRTPTKKFYFSTLPKNKGTLPYYVNLIIYKNGKYKDSVGTQINVYSRY